MNQLCKDILQWQKKSSQRKKDGVFLVEGIKMYEELPEEQLLHTVVSESFNRSENHRIIKKNVPCEVVADALFIKLSDTKTPQGILGVAKRFEYSLSDIINTEKGLFVILETLQDPGNLGTILRASEAAGVDGVIMNSSCVDVYNPKVIRSTMGSVFRMKFAVEDNLRDVVGKIQSNGGKCYAARLEESNDYDRMNYSSTTAFLIGNEANGLTGELSEACSDYVKIPMLGRVESLNAAMAATILVFEASRQRRN